MKNYKSKIIITLSFSALFSSIWVNSIMANLPLEEKLKGRILLQVEDKGEAWYVFPNDLKRYYLGRPDYAFTLMKDLGMGITNDDISKIPIAEANFNGEDNDNDGLSNAIEDSLGTDKNNSDSDNDGHDDRTEIINQHNPKDSGKYTIDNALAKKLSGLILIQTEQNGEAWYVNPNNLKRYYLGRPIDAFNLMKSLGLGITNNDISKIAKLEIKPEYISENVKNNSTKIVKDNPSLREYNEDDKYSFQYPSSWKIKKFEDSPSQIQISDAYKDFIAEKKGVIIIHLIETEDDYEVNNFKIAKNSIKKLSEKDLNIKNKIGFERSYQYNLAYEKTSIIKISPKKYLRISLMTSEKEDKYDQIFDNLLDSLNFPEN